MRRGKAASRGDKQPRVAFVINELASGGAQRVFVDDANAFVSAGAQVLFCTLYDRADEYVLARELDAAIERMWLKARGPLDLRAAMRCARAVRAARINVLMTTLNDANTFGPWVALLSRFAVRLIRREGNTPRRKPLWQRVLDVLCDGVIYRIVAVSDDVRRDLIRSAPWRERKVMVLRNAVALPPRAQSDGRAASRILTVGRMTAQKDHATLLAALGMLARAGQHVTAEIIGDGSLSAATRDRASDEGIAERVVFRGSLPHDAVLCAYAGADIFVLSSLWEGCPNVLLEAMAHGLPIVATAVGGVPELVEHEMSGLLVPPGDAQALAGAVSRLVADAALRAALGKAARSRAELFTPDVRFQRLYDLVTSPPAD